MTERWIVIPRWEQFQHRDAARVEVPTWIKVYPRLLSDEGYVSLTPARRALLLGIWLEYARTRRELPENTATLSRRLAQRVLRRDLEALNHAGFIEFSASRDASMDAGTDASLEKRRVEDPPTPLPRGASNITPKDLVSCAVCGALSVERGRPCPECGASPRDAGSNHRATRKQPKKSPYEVAEIMTRNVGWQYPLDAYRDELNRFDLAATERDLLEHLWSKLASEPAKPDAEPEPPLAEPEPVKLEELF